MSSARRSSTPQRRGRPQYSGSISDESDDELLGRSAPRGGVPSKSTDPIRATNASSPSSSSTSDDIDAVLVDAPPTRGAARNPRNPRSTRNSRSQSSLVGRPNLVLRVHERRHGAVDDGGGREEPRARGDGSGGSPGKRRRNDDDSDPFLDYCCSHRRPAAARRERRPRRGRRRRPNDDATRTRDSRGNARRAGANRCAASWRWRPRRTISRLKVLDLAESRLVQLRSFERERHRREKFTSERSRARDAAPEPRASCRRITKCTPARTSSRAAAGRRIAADRRATFRRRRCGETSLSQPTDPFYAGLAVIFATTLAGGWRRATAPPTSVVSVCPAPIASTTSSGLAGRTWAGASVRARVSCKRYSAATAAKGSAPLSPSSRGTSCSITSSSIPDRARDGRAGGAERGAGTSDETRWTAAVGRRSPDMSSRFAFTSAHRRRRHVASGERATSARARGTRRTRRLFTSRSAVLPVRRPGALPFEDVFDDHAAHRGEQKRPRR